MALRRPLSTALACQNCQRWILRSFISTVGGQSAGRTTIPQRPFSIAHRRRNEARERIQKADEHPLNEINEEFASPSPATTTNSTSQSSYQPPQTPLPWYLQHQPPIQQPTNPLLSRQQLPTLPPHAPPILSPLLTHLSLELGINDLHILDLRTLDPPPALGANLLMLLGTARSEKHLHITSDRLCRWLRSTHHLRPHADGLLGRNELKLKLKRRAKRSRLLSAVGAKATEVEEGMRTGWVCVNVGRVEGGEVPGRERRLEGVVGFGPGEVGCGVVVQLLTEERRGEVDLEGLWGKSLGRVREGGAVEEGGGREVGGVEDLERSGEEDGYARQGGDSISASYQRFASVSHQSTEQQARAYHTSSRHLQATSRTQHLEPDEDYFVLAAKQPKEATTAEPSEKAPTTTSDASKLASMVAKLKSIPPTHALRILGKNVLSASQHLSIPTDPDTNTPQPEQNEPQPKTTSFLRSFYASMPPYPTPAHWHEHIALLAHARALGVHEIHSTVLIAQLRNMQISGLLPQERTFKLVLEAALGPMGRRVDGVQPTLSSTKLSNILAVLEDMEACGYDPTAPDVLALLYAAYVGPTQTDTALDLKTAVSQLSAHRLHRLAREGDWPSFWRTWRSYPQRFLPRSAGTYTVLFSILSEGLLADTRQTVDVLKTALEDMEREQPAVILEGNAELAGAVARALEYVEPRLKDARGEGAGREWRAWYARCLNVCGGG